MSAPRQGGIALLTVLLLVAVVAVLVTAMLDDMRFGLRRAGNAEALSQARWHALGAEALARRQIARIVARDRERTTLEGDWNGRPFVFPVDGGAIRATLSDGSSCFNLNAVVGGVGESLTASDDGLRQYRVLLEAIGFGAQEAVALSDALVDWIDSDGRRSARGHEDGSYTRGRDGHRTGGTLLAEPSELLAVRGYTPAAYARLRPFVCALPVAGTSPVNVNTLDAGDAPLLSALLDGGLDVGRAQALIAARPAGGWASLSEFWASPLLDGVAAEAAEAQLALRSRWFRLHAEVDYGPAEVVLGALLEDTGGDAARVRWRRWEIEE